MKDLKPTPPESTPAPPWAAQILIDLAHLIHSTRKRVAYGEQIVSTLSRQLGTGYSAGFSRQNLFHNPQRKRR